MECQLYSVFQLIYIQISHCISYLVYTEVGFKPSIYYIMILKLGGGGNTIPPPGL